MWELIGSLNLRVSYQSCLFKSAEFATVLSVWPVSPSSPLPQKKKQKNKKHQKTTELKKPPPFLNVLLLRTSTCKPYIYHSVIHVTWKGSVFGFSSLLQLMQSFYSLNVCCSLVYLFTNSASPGDICNVFYKMHLGQQRELWRFNPGFDNTSLCAYG